MIPGYSGSHTVPIYNGRALHPSSAGRDLTKGLTTILTEQRYSFTRRASRRRHHDWLPGFQGVCTVVEHYNVLLVSISALKKPTSASGSTSRFRNRLEVTSFLCQFATFCFGWVIFMDVYSDTVIVKALCTLCETKVGLPHRWWNAVIHIATLILAFMAKLCCLERLKIALNGKCFTICALDVYGRASAGEERAQCSAVQFSSCETWPQVHYFEPHVGV